MPPAAVESATALYLTRVSELLATSSPTTSAYLGSQQNEVQLRDGKSLLDGVHHQMCLTCGTLMVPGLTCISSRGKPIPKKGRPKTGHLGPPIHAALVQTCRVCHRKTVAPVVPADIKASYHDKKTYPSMSQRAALPSAANHNAASVAEPSSARTSGKQRAKARKDKSGLQALLNKNKASTNSTPPLDLMDFMKA